MSEFLWVEKYRPKTIDQCILPTDLQKTFNDYVKSEELPNMMFTGSAGVGKTTVAKALCNELGLDYIMINGSEEGNIDTLRNKIKHFASTVSLQGGYKVVILDEADYLNPQSTQPALRGFIEEFSNNCRFILTCNFKNRNIEPIHSRCSWYEFAKEIFKINNIDTKLLIPVSSNKYPTRLKRPNFSVLSSDKIKNKYKFAIPSWMDALKDNFELVNE